MEVLVEALVVAALVVGGAVAIYIPRRTAAIRKKLMEAVEMTVSAVSPESERIRLAVDFPYGIWFRSDDGSRLVVVNGKMLLRTAAVVNEILASPLFAGKTGHPLNDKLLRLLRDENLVLRARALVEAMNVKAYTSRYTLVLHDEPEKGARGGEDMRSYSRQPCERAADRN